MNASDVMTTDIVSVHEDATVRELAAVLIKHQISAVPVLDRSGQGLVGIVSEGDLLRQVNGSGERHRSWWLTLLASDAILADDFVKEHAGKVSDLMSRTVISVSPDTPVGEIARILEVNRIKRVPVIDNGHIVGIVSRSNLVQALATLSSELRGTATSETDAVIRTKVLQRVRSYPWTPFMFNVSVRAGRVELWGMVASESQKDAARVAAESVPGVREVKNNLVLWPSGE